MIEVRDISMKCDDISQQKNLFFFFFSILPQKNPLLQIKRQEYKKGIKLNVGCHTLFSSLQQQANTCHHLTQKKLFTTNFSYQIFYIKY
jgi:hypothetical protein